MKEQHVKEEFFAMTRVKDEPDTADADVGEALGRGIDVLADEVDDIFVNGPPRHSSFDPFLQANLAYDDR